jgi:hypothetical protein
MTRLKHATPEPETRVGICCGDACKIAHDKAGAWSTAALFKVPGIYRYRCADCYVAEVGRRHPLS